LIVEFLKEVAPYKPVLFISSQADNIAYTPFLMLIHSEGNGIIGGRVRVELEPHADFVSFYFLRLSLSM
jgi:hypothetical protein